MEFERISVIGLGYIGLPTAAVLASRKKRVIGVDINPTAVETVNRGQIHIVEPELDMMVHAAVTEGYLRASVTPEPADAFLIAVPTPFKEGHVPDLSYIEAAAQSIAHVLRAGNLVVLESTSPVGATELLAGWLAEARRDLTFPQTHGEASDIRIAHCPERVLPGRILREIVQNDRVIGGLTRACSESAISLYRLFVEGACIATDVRTAEMCKLAENSFRDVNIAFANELSILCDRLGVDIWELIRLANRHPRVNILQPGAGVGGHCIAVDPWFIASASPEEARLIRTAREVNDSKPDWVVDKVRQAIQSVRNRSGATDGRVIVACLGLSFKPDIDDLRESPAVRVAEALARMPDCDLRLVEPNIRSVPGPLAEYPKVELGEALDEADVVVLLVAHGAFRGVRSTLRPDQLLVMATEI